MKLFRWFRDKNNNGIDDIEEIDRLNARLSWWSRRYRQMALQIDALKNAIKDVQDQAAKDRADKAQALFDKAAADAATVKALAEKAAAIADKDAAVAAVVAEKDAALAEAQAQIDALTKELEGDGGFGASTN